MSWETLSDLGWILPVLGGFGGTVGWIFKGKQLAKALDALKEIRALILFWQKAMADGKLSEVERDELVDRIGEVVKAFV